MGKQCVILKDETDVTPVRRIVRDLDVVEENSTAGRFLKTGDHPQRRRFSTAGRTEKREELAISNFQIDCIDDWRLALSRFAAREGLRESFQRECGHLPPLPLMFWDQ